MDYTPIRETLQSREKTSLGYRNTHNDRLVVPLDSLFLEAEAGSRPFAPCAISHRSVISLRDIKLMRHARTAAQERRW